MNLTKELQKQIFERIGKDLTGFVGTRIDDPLIKDTICKIISNYFDIDIKVICDDSNNNEIDLKKGIVNVTIFRNSSITI